MWNLNLGILFWCDEGLQGGTGKMGKLFKILPWPGPMRIIPLFKVPLF